MLHNSRNLSGAVANQSGAMEAETILKHGRSSKSQMSRGNKKRGIGITIACVAILFCVSFTFKFHESSVSNTDQIIGMWKMVSTDMEGEMLKTITKGHFVWTHTVNNVIVRSAGGTYTFDGETYIENIKYGTQSMSNFFGQKAVVKIRFEGKKIHYNGLLAGIVPLNEVWERVE